MLLLGVALATGLDETMAGIESDIVEGFVGVPASVAGLVVSIVSVLFLLLAIGAPISLLVARRFRTFAVGGLGIVLAAVAFVVVRDAVPVRTLSLPEGTQTAFVEQGGWPSGGALAVYTAAALIAAIELPRRWRRAVWVMLGVLTTLRVLTAADPPLDVLLAIGVGGVVGSSLLLVLGRTARVASEAGVRDALERSGLAVSDVQPLTLERGSREFRALTDVEPVRAKVVGRESQQLDSLYRAYRRVRLRDVVAGVFLFRCATFWLPILPGLLAFRWLTARGAI